jgi:tetratricopeptide (TPR) repeat protein
MAFRTTALFCTVAALTLATFAASAQMFARGNGLVNESAYALDRKNWRQGVSLAQEALRSGELMPTNMPAAYNNLCIGLTGMGKFDEAMDACDKAITLKPRQWSFYNNRGNIYFYRSEFDRALAEYYKALTFSPGDDVLLQNIALSLKVRKGRGAAKNQSS